MKIKLIKSSFYNETETKKKLADFILSASILSMGDQCREYEKAFAIKQKTKHAVFVSSGSTANLILIQALLNLGRLKVGDKVGFSALTWATNVMPLLQLGLIPVAIDCELNTLNTSPYTLEPHLKELRALFITNVLGFCDRLDVIADLCRKHSILFFEDNCESLGSEMQGKLLGNFGSASTFSFFVGHHLSTIEGGMVCTNDDELHDMLVMIRAHGWDRNLSPERQASLRAGYRVDDFFAKYTFYDLAYNVRPTEINGFLGNLQIQYWDTIVKKRVDHFKRFQAAALSNSNFVPLSMNHMSVVSNFAMPIVCKNNEAFLEYKKKFEANEVEIRPIIAGDITQQPFYQKYVSSQIPCSHARLIHQNGFYFGNNADMTSEEIDYLCHLLKSL